MVGRIRAKELGLALGGDIAADVDHGLRGLQVQVPGDLSELQVEVDQQDRATGVLGDRRGGVDRDRRRPDAALGAEDGHHLAALRRARVGGQDRGEVTGALEAEQQGLHTGLQLARVEGLGDHVVRACLEEPDPLVDLV